jgi:ferric-dicitrate binding protein FerR (iron transport regulator)
MTTQDAQLLLQRYLAGDCTAEEKELLEAWWAELQAEFPWEVPVGQEGIVHDRMLSKIKGELGGELWAATGEQELRRALASGDEGPTPEVPIRRMEWRRYAGIAAAVLVVAAGGWFWWSRHNGAAPMGAAAIATIEAAPGSNKAVLTLGNGKEVVLDSAANGMLAMQGNAQVMKQNGQLDYQQDGEGSRSGKTILFNTLATPRGGKYQLVLSDGTKVWLDAASSITYPTAFVGKTRQVSISGQAYFEVVHNSTMPFEVKVQGQIVRDIGTAFNINAYSDEPTMKITLANGAVAVGGPGNTVTLRQAGQQADCREGQMEPVHNADLAAVLAWKNGLFYLTSADIASVMRQIGRWYDVDIQFEKGVPAGHITGELPRNTMLSTVLQVLQTSGVHFTVEGKKIHVTP